MPRRAQHAAAEWPEEHARSERRRTRSESQRSREAEADEAPTLIDASALIALLGNEPAAGEVREILRNGATITAVNLTEAVDRLGRRYRLDIERVRPIVDGLLEDSLMVTPITSVEAWRSAEIRIAHYHRTSCPLSLADAALIACGGQSRRIATSDSHVLRIAKREGIDVIPLPDSTGRRPR